MHNQSQESHSYNLQYQTKQKINTNISAGTTPVGWSPFIQRKSSRFLCWKCRTNGCKEFRRCKNITA